MRIMITKLLTLRLPHLSDRTVLQPMASVVATENRKYLVSNFAVRFILLNFF